MNEKLVKIGDEIRALMRKHDVAGHVVLCDDTDRAFSMAEYGATWSVVEHNNGTTVMDLSNSEKTYATLRAMAMTRNICADTAERFGAELERMGHVGYAKRMPIKEHED